MRALWFNHSNYKYLIMPGIISELIHGGIKGIGDAAKSVIDSINAPKEEKDRANLALQSEIDRHQEVLLNNASDIEKTYLADVQDARGSNAKVQDSVNASWLSKNVGYMIDIFITCLWGGLTAYLMLIMLNLVKNDNHVDYTAVTAVWGAVTGVFTQVLSFHRGSSRGSEEKQKTIDRLTK